MWDAKTVEVGADKISPRVAPTANNDKIFLLKTLYPPKIDQV